MAKKKTGKKKTSKKAKYIRRTLSAILGMLCLLSIEILALWFIQKVHPGIKTGSAAEKTEQVDLSARMDTTCSNAKVDAMNFYNTGDFVYQKVYRIEDGGAIPKPNPNGYGSIPVTNADQMNAVIDQARECGLLEGQELIFNPNANFIPYTTIEYYFDESILVINWKEMRNGERLTFSEVKVGDGSQLIRKIADDTYGSEKQYFCSDFASQINSVVCYNADFYTFRNQGITCYNGEIHRSDLTLDTLFIDQNGDFRFYHRGTETTKEQLQQYVTDNNIKFSLSFGPVLVEDGELQDVSSYPIGQPLEEFSRSGIAQVDTRHYLFLNVAYYSAEEPGCNIQDFARFMYDLGVQQAYNLDGGQTSEVFFHGKIFNYLNYSNERTVSDVIYFATAIPEEEQK